MTRLCELPWFFPASFIFRFVSWFFISSIKFKAQLLLVQKLDCFSWRPVLWTTYLCTHFFIHGWTNTFKVSPRPFFGQICLGFLCFIFISRKAYRRYIPASRDFHSSLGLSLFVDEVMEARFIYHMYLKIQTILII